MAETLADYGVERRQVLALPPGLLTFLDATIADAAELEESAIRLRSDCCRAQRELKRLRRQRAGLLGTLQTVEQDGTRPTERASTRPTGQAGAAPTTP